MSAQAVAEGTFVLADLAGYTALTEAHGDEYAAALAGAFCARVRTLIAEEDGLEVNFIGDALLLWLSDPAAAARLAARVVADHGGHEQLGVRVGLHTGPAIRDGEAWFGAAINLAARLADLAGAGEVLLTHATRQALPATIATRPRGRRAFKNVARPVEIHELLLEDSAPGVLALDPVCRMRVDPALAAATRNHHGVEHAFCSRACHDRFDADPHLYTTTPRPPAGRLIPAAGRRGLTRAYDLGMALTMRQAHWRPILLHAALADLPRGGTLLEVGAGTGSNAIELARRRPDATIIATDGDLQALHIAQRKPNADAVQWHHQLAHEPAPGPLVPDVALASLLLHHLTDPDKHAALIALAAQLGAPGVLHIADWGPPRGLTRLGARALNTLDGHEGPASLLNGQLRSLLSDAGLKDARRTWTGPTAWGQLELWRATPAAAGSRP